MRPQCTIYIYPSVFPHTDFTECFSQYVFVTIHTSSAAHIHFLIILSSCHALVAPSITSFVPRLLTAVFSLHLTSTTMPYIYCAMLLGLCLCGLAVSGVALGLLSAGDVQ